MSLVSPPIARWTYSGWCWRRQVKEVPAFGHEATALLEGLASHFSIADAAAVKEVERTTNHDVKAIEYVLKERFAANEELASVSPRSSLPDHDCSGVLRTSSRVKTLLWAMNA